MSRSILIIILTLVVTLTTLAAPRLALDSPSVDFGEVAANAARVRDVRVGNAGDAPLMVSRVEACCGAKASLAGTAIPAGVGLGLTPMVV